MGRVIKETSPSGRSVNYVWGGNGCSLCAGSDAKLTKIIDSGNKQWEFKYDIMGNAVEMIYPNGTKLEQEFDIANRLTRFRNKRGHDIFVVESLSVYAIQFGTTRRVSTPADQ